MRALRAAMRWDARLLARGPVAWIALVVLVGATAIAVVSGARFRARWEADAARQLELLREEERDHAARLARGDARAASPMLLTTRIALPPAPLAELAVGRADLDPRDAKVSVASHGASLFRDYQTANPVALAAGRFDLGFVVVYLLPLIVIALGYGLLAEERERGLDRLLAVHGVPARRLALARAALRAALVAAPLVAGLAVLLALGPLTAERAARAALAAAAVLGYAALWWGIVLAVASLRLREGTALLALLVAWVALTLVVPAIAGAAARTAHPAPSRFTLIAASRAAEVAAVARAKELIGGYVHDHPELDAAAAAAAPAFAQRAFVTAREIERATRGVVEEFDRALEAQRAAAARWQLVAPALLAHRALAAIAGTDEERALAFRDQARAYAAEWRESVARLGLGGARVDAALLAARPRFALAEPPLAGVAAGVAGPIALLWGLAAALALLAARRLGGA